MDNVDKAKEKYNDYRKDLEDELQCALPNLRSIIDERAEIINVLIDAYKAIESLDDKALGMVRPAGRFEEYPAKYELISNMRKALEKAGVDL